MKTDDNKINEQDRYIRSSLSTSPWKTATPKYSPVNQVRIKDMEINIDLRKMKEKIADVEVKLKIEAFGEKCKNISLDAIELDVKSITNTKGDSLSFELLNENILIDLIIEEGKTEEIVIKYTVNNPKAGLMFIEPNGVKNRTYQIHTQGETEDARYWLPCIDFPSQLFTTRMIARVPKGFTAVSNGKLVSETTEDDGSITFDWLQNKPHPSYLITLTVGTFKKYCETDYKIVDLCYLADDQFSLEDIQRTFKDTPKFMDFFIKHLGPYPWDKYWQIVCHDFTGAMENTSATTWSFDAIKTQDYLEVFPHGIDATNIHEMAHQWYGDLIVVKHWSHAWVKEGMAVFLESLYWRENVSEDEYLYDMLLNKRSYVGETKKYKRTLNENRYDHSWQLYDAHTYPGAAWRYNMVFHKFGEEKWWQILRHFLDRHKHTSVTSNDMMYAIEDVTGYSMESFFDQWVFRPGLPILKVKSNFDKDNGVIIISIEQSQAKNKDKEEIEFDINQLFKFPLEIGWLDENNKWNYNTVNITDYKQTFAISATKPKVVQIDPNFKVIMELKYDIPEKQAKELLKSATNVLGRIDAMKSLCKNFKPDNVDIIMKAIENESHWGGHSELVTEFAKTKSPLVESSLIKYIEKINDNYQYLAHVIAAIGSFESEIAAKTLLPYLTHKNTLIASVTARNIPMTQYVDILPSLEKLLERDSLNHQIHSSLSLGLGSLRDIKAVALLQKIAFDKTLPPLWVRFRAILSLSENAIYLDKKEKDDLIAKLKKLFHEDINFLIGIAAARTLAALNAGETRQDIEQFKTKLPNAMKTSIQKVLDDLNEKDTVPKEIKELRDNLEEIRKDNKKLSDRLSKLEALSKKK